MKSRCIVWLLAGVCALPCAAQTSQEEFGQNRVQYKDFTWSYFHDERFNVYFYLGGQDLGKFTIATANKEMGGIEEQLEYKLNEPIDIMVYNNLGDLKQSNIGYGIDVNNSGGTTKIIGDKMFVYFDGNHQHLQTQIREGIAAVLLQNMLFGGNLQEVVQNALLLSVPDWYSKGLVSYMGETWSTELDNVLRDGILSGRYRDFNKLSATDARFVGHSIWNYIAIKYGDSNIPNILYLTRINRNMESGFNFVLGKTSNEIIDEWYTYYTALYSQEITGKQPVSDATVITKRERTDRVYSQFRVNSDAKYAAFTSNTLGKFKVCLRNIETGRTKTVLKGGFKNITQPIDYSQPLLAFDPTGNSLAMIYEKHGDTYLRSYDLEKKKAEKKKQITNFQKVLSMSFAGDPNVLVLSAENKGQSDIYLYKINSASVTQITNDVWDDLNPRYVKLTNRQGILFSSNRMNDTLRTQAFDTLSPVKNYDLYFYNMKKKSKELVHVSHTLLANETAPTPFNADYFSFLSDQNGIANRNVAYIDSYFHHYDYYYFFHDSTIINPKYNMDSMIHAANLTLDSTWRLPIYKDTAIVSNYSNYASGILDQDYTGHSKKLAQVMLKNGKYEFSLVPTQEVIDKTQIPSLVNTSFATAFRKQKEETPTVVTIPAPVPHVTGMDTTKADTSTTKNNYIFQSEFSAQEPKVLKDSTEKLKPVKSLFHYGRILPYTPKFSTQYVVTQLDNDLIISRYQAFNPNAPYFNPPPLNGLMKVSISDLMEDYRFTGAFRLPQTLTGSEYYLQFENLRKRLDERYTVYRNVTSTFYEDPNWYLPVNIKLRTYIGDMQLRYPLDFTKSLRLNVQFRDDRTTNLATDSFSLKLPATSQQWAIVHGEYVFDNTLKIQTNIYDGTRYKFYADAQRQINGSNSYLFAAGADFRHYQKIHRNFIWATRLSASTSWGDQKVVYYLGGTNNWLFPQPTFNSGTPVATDAGYAFQTIAVDLRGFDQNIRNGNSFALINTELRFPVFSYFFSSRIRSELVKNFQIVSFADAGTAWQGTSPYDNNNPFNTATVTQGPVTVLVDYFREPIVAGFGLGARTTILGYFLRLDYAQGVDSGEWLPPKWYLSLGLDF